MRELCGLRECDVSYASMWKSEIKADIKGVPWRIDVDDDLVELFYFVIFHVINRPQTLLKQVLQIRGLNKLTWYPFLSTRKVWIRSPHQLH